MTRVRDFHVRVHRCPQGRGGQPRRTVGVAAAQREMFGLGADARVLMVAAPTFDASVGEWLLAVRRGRRWWWRPRTRMPGRR